MSTPIFTALTGSPWEGELVARLERGGGGLHVVRRCVDLADLLSAAATGAGRAVLLAADLRRLDRDALARLAAAGVAPVGVVAAGDEAGHARLRLLGVLSVVPPDAPAGVLASVVAAAVRTGWAGAGEDRAYAEPLAALPADPLSEATGRPGPAGPAGPAALAGTAGPAGSTWAAGVAGGGDAEPDSGAPLSAPGTLVAVWGPTGAPGRTTLAVGLAAELAAAGTDTVLADADVYGGVVAQVLGLLDEAPGLAAAARQANAGTLDLAGLARVAPFVSPHLRVLTGLSRSDRWPELRAPALEPVWVLARRLADVVVVDCGFNLEREEEISFDTAAPRRNGATLLTLEQADVVLAVGAADPVGLSRLVRGLSELREAVPGGDVRVVLNKVRRGPVGADPQRQLAAALSRYAGVRDPRFVPYDQAGLDAALLLGRPLPESAAGSPVRAALRDLAADLLGQPVSRSRRRWPARRPAYG